MKQETSAHRSAVPAGSAAPRPRLEELDGLRGLLALYVVIYHLQDPLKAVSAELVRRVPLLIEAWFAVDAFFVMSGFVMMYVYGETFARKIDWPSYRKFFVARIARLYPVHLAAMAALAVVLVPRIYHLPDFQAWEGRYSWSTGIASLFMLHSPWIEHRTWNFPSWSISAEWHAYLLFPFLVRTIAASGRTWLVLIASAGTLVTFGLYLLKLEPDPYPTNGIAVLLRVLPLFITGMALYPINRAWGRHFRSGPLALVVVAAILALLSVPALAAGSVLLVPFLILFTLNSTALRAPLSTAPARFLGAISYSLYMTHALIMLLAYPVIFHFGQNFFGPQAVAGSVFGWIVFGASVAGSVLLGYLTWRFIEVPSRKTVTDLLTRGVARKEKGKVI